MEVDRHYYSVPHALIHAAVEICLTATTVDVLLRGARVWLHVRSHQAGRHTTIRSTCRRRTARIWSGAPPA